MSRPVAVLTSEVGVASQLEPSVALVLRSISVVERMKSDDAVVDFDWTLRAWGCSACRDEWATGNETRKSVICQ